MFDNPGLTFTWDLLLTRDDLEQRTVFTSPIFRFVEAEPIGSKAETLWNVCWKPHAGHDVSCTLQLSRTLIKRTHYKRHGLSQQQQQQQQDWPSLVPARLPYQFGHHSLAHSLAKIEGTKVIPITSWTLAPSADHPFAETTEESDMNSDREQMVFSRPECHGTKKMIAIVSEQGTTKFRISFHAGAQVETIKQEYENKVDFFIRAARVEWSNLHRSKHPFDVCFVFTQSGRRLWEQSNHLDSKSTFWRALITNGFDESIKKPPEEGCHHSFHLIKVFENEEEGEDLYNAYDQILTWTRTGAIQFGPLPRRSLESAESGEVDGLHRSLAEIDLNMNSEDDRPTTAQGGNDEQDASIAAVDSRECTSTPATSSPSTDLVDPTDPTDPTVIFQICQFIQLDELALIALHAISQRLTVDNVIPQLFTTTLAWKHANYKRCLLRFCAAESNRHDPTIQRHLNIVKQQLDADESPIPSNICGSLLVDLALAR